MYIYIMHPISSSLNIQNIAPKFPELSPCNGLVIKYAVVPSVAQYFIINFTFLAWYVRKQYLTFKFLVLLLDLFLLFSCSRIVILLSWYKNFVATYTLVLPEKSWSIIPYLTRHSRLLTPPTICFSYSVFVFVTEILLLLFPLLMLLLYAI